MTREPLSQWLKDNPVKEEMYWKAAAEAQFAFVRTRLLQLVAADLGYEEGHDLARVISTHTSKSILLPVYELPREDLGLRLILRNNFYDWKLSVISEAPIRENFQDLFKTGEDSYRHPVYFEGFPRDLIFGGYDESDEGRKWSASVGGDERLWATVFLICRARGIRPKV